MHWTRYGNRPQEEVVDLFSDEGTQTQKFAVDSMQNRLQKVSFPEDKGFRLHHFPRVLFCHQEFVMSYRNHLGSSESKSSSNWRTNFWSITFFPAKRTFLKSWFDRSGDNIKIGPKSRQSNLLRVGSLGTRGTGGRIHRQAVENDVSLSRLKLLDAIIARIGI